MPPSTPSRRLTATILLLVAAIGTANAQQPSGEAAAVSRDVLARESWVAESRKCPTEVIAEKQDRSYLDENACKPGQFVACLSRCSASNPGACYWLAYELQLANAQPSASEVLFQQSCKFGVVSGCTNRAAGMSADSPKDPAVQACAAATFEKTCVVDDAWGCTMYAFHLARGIGVARDPGLALKVLEKSCKYGDDDPACSHGMALRDELQGRK